MLDIITLGLSVISLIGSVFIAITSTRKDSKHHYRCQRAKIFHWKSTRKHMSNPIYLCCIIIVFVLSFITLIIPTIDELKFGIAINMRNEGEFEKAQIIFKQLNENNLYLDSTYSYAKQLIASGKNMEALKVFADLGEYKDSKQYLSTIVMSSPEDDKREEKYVQACKFYDDGDFNHALNYFRELSGYKDSEQMAQLSLSALREKLANTISAGISLSVGIKNDGSVVVSGDASSFDFPKWTDIVSISNLGVIAIGLKDDGSVITSGELHVDVDDWSDVVAVSAGERYVVALKSDGTVLGAGHDAGDGQLKVTAWTDIVAIATGWRHTVALDSDGAIYITGYGSTKQLKEISKNYSQWENVIAIAAGGGDIVGKGHTVGLRSDGTVVAVGDNAYGQCDVDDWNNVIAIAAGDWHTVGLCADGTVLSTRPDANKYPDMYLAACDVSSWTDIAQIAAGSGYTLGLHSDGTVIATGYNDYNKRDGTQSWNNVKIPQTSPST